MALGTPTADELGFAKSLEVEELGGQMVIRLEQAETKGKVRSLVFPHQAFQAVSPWCSCPSQFPISSEDDQPSRQQLHSMSR